MIGLDDREDPRFAERLREAMPPLDLGGRAAAKRVEPGVKARPDGMVGSMPVARHWLHATWGQWTLRIAAVAFLALDAWYGMSAARRVATNLTPRLGALGTLVDHALGGPGGAASQVRANGVKRATDADIAELIRLEREKDQLRPA